MQNKASYKQAFLYSIINYLGIGIGVVSTLFIYPKNKEMLGTFRFIEALSQILFPILLLGTPHALINFGPKLNQNQQKKLFNYSIVSILIMTFVLLSVIFFESFFIKNSKYFYLALPIAFFVSFIELFKKQAAIIQKIATITFFETIIPKITLPVVFLLFIYNVFSKQNVLYIYVFSYFLIFFFCGIYLFYFYRPKFDFNFTSLFTNISKKEYYKYSLFSFAGSLGSLFAFRIDSLMIPKFISMEANGAFSIGVTLASALSIPATGVFVLYAPIVSNYIKNNQLLDLNVKYKEVAKMLFFIGALIYSGLFLGISDFFSLLPTHNNLTDSIPIILILGINVLINMATGFNAEIITYSKYYKFNSVAIAILIVLNVSLNFLVLKYYHLGIIAVAYVSLFSMGAFNLAKLVFIYKKMKLFPFDRSFIKMILIFAFFLFIVNSMPNLNNGFFNLIYKITFCLSLNLIVIYQLNILPNYNFWVKKIVLLIKQKLLFWNKKKK